MTAHAGGGFPDSGEQAAAGGRRHIGFPNIKMKDSQKNRRKKWLTEGREHGDHRVGGRR